MIEPVRLLALAAEVEKEGQYNTAKLLRSAATALLTRAAWEDRVPSDTADQAVELERIAAEIEGTPASSIVASLAAAASALRGSRVALYREAPDPFVCRICGLTRVDPFVDRCPDCGRWPNTAERIRPIYWARASTPPESLDLLETTPAIVIRAFETGVPHVPGPDGGWTAHQTLEHLHNAQSLFRGRIDQLLAGGEPELASVMVWTIAGEGTATEGLLEAYLDLRSEIVDLLRDADPEAWWNRGHHEEFGTVTLAEQASYFANHEPTHLGQLLDAASERD
jgi:hypothetical protein